VTATQHDDRSMAASDFSLDRERIGLGTAVHNFAARLRTGGDLGLAPAVLALVVLIVFFTVRVGDTFFTKLNFGDLIGQAAPICLMSVAVTYVLLLGEIDLAAGYTAGVSAAFMATRLKDGNPLLVALLVGFGAALVIGLVTGWLVARVGIPSFVVTLSFFLTWQGVLLQVIGNGGTIAVRDRFVVGLYRNNMSPVWGWVFWAVVTGGLALVGTLQLRERAVKGLGGAAASLVYFRVAVVGVVWGVATWVLNQTRGNGLQGVPVIVPVVAGLIGVLSFALRRTAWGRHLYAVGGNVEAARRAGINVLRVKISAFVMCALVSCVAGIVLVARLGSVDPQTGGNDTLLIAVGAAVIGGTSLFGGRGRLVNGVVGGLVFAVINNGLTQLGKQGPFDFSASGPKFIVNGLVLLLFASIDALSRKRAGTT
jgi:D-xylose transport system permease protein